MYMPPGTRSGQFAPLKAEPPKARDEGRYLSDAELKALSKRIQFRWPHAAHGSYKVDFMIELDAKGNIARLTKRKASGLPELDAEFEKALRASAPFGPQIRRRFGLNYEWRHGPAKKVPAEAAPAPEQAG
jgi:hypothetical protein